MANSITTEPFNGDLKLLLGYQLLGLEEYDKAEELLLEAGQAAENEDSVVILLELLETVKAEEAMEDQEPEDFWE